MATHLTYLTRPSLRECSSDYETPVRRVATSKSTNKRGNTVKKKINPVSKASLALLSPAHAMGFEVETSQSQDTPKSIPAPFPQSHDRDLSAAEDATPELEAFTVADLQTGLTKSRLSTESLDADPLRLRRQRDNTLASVFVSDADASSSKPKSGRRVAFRVPGGSQDLSTRDVLPGGRSNHRKSSLGQASDSSSGSSFARFFNWKKSAGKKSFHQSAFSDVFGLQPSSAPPRIATFDHSLCPPRNCDSFSDNPPACGSLPVTPLLGATVPLSASLETPIKVMPHRKTGPPPRSILRKQKAPAQRPQRDQNEPMQLSRRSFEQPRALLSSLPLNRKAMPRREILRQQPPFPLSMSATNNASSSRSSFTERRYSTMGRGVARHRRPSDASMSTVSNSTRSLASNIKSPTKRGPDAAKPLTSRQFEGLSTSFSINPLMYQGAKQADGGLSSPRGTLFSLPEQKIASKVKNGLIKSAKGFEEPIPSSNAANSLGLDLSDASQAKSFRRRSRSVGTLEGQTLVNGQGLFAVTTAVVQEPATPLIGLGRGQPLSAGQHWPQLGQLGTCGNPPTQQKAAVFTGGVQALTAPAASPSRSVHKSEGSQDSVSSDEEDVGESAIVTTVQARRVQLVNTRAKVTAFSSPNLSRSPHLKSSIPVVNVLPPSSPSVLFSSPPSDHIQVETNPQASPVRKAAPPPRCLVADLDEETLRKRWSKRDSCILALSMAQVHLPDEFEDAYDLSSVRENAITKDFLSSLPEDSSLTGLGFQTTAPLNIRPRGHSDKIEDDACPPADSAVALTPSFSQSFSVIGDPFPYYASHHSVASSAQSELQQDKTAGAEQEPKILTFAPSDYYSSEATAASLPSLDSSSGSSTASTCDIDNLDDTNDRSTTPTPGGLNVIDASTSIASIATVGTSIFEFGMPQEEAKRYVHRANLSEDGSAAHDGAEDATTPTLTSTSFGTLPPRPAAINVSHHHTQESLSMGAMQEPPVNLLDLNLGTGAQHGRSLNLMASNRSSPRSSPTFSTAKTSRCSAFSRSITPTQGMQPRRDGGAVQDDALKASMGLGFDLGHFRVSKPGLKSGQVHHQLSCKVGAGHWEDKLLYFRPQNHQTYKPQPQPVFSDQDPHNLDESQIEWELGVAL